MTILSRKGKEKKKPVIYENMSERVVTGEIFVLNRKEYKFQAGSHQIRTFVFVSTIKNNRHSKKQ